MVRLPAPSIRHASVALLLAASAAATCGACSAHTPRAQHGKTPSSGRTAGASSSTRPRAATTTTAQPNPRPSPIDTSQTTLLRAHLVSSIPGYVLRPAGGTATGPSTLASAAEDAGGGNGELEALRSAGFVTGYKLLFSAANSQVLELAYRFASAAGAARYAAHAYATRVHDSSTPSSTTLPGIPGSRVVDRSDSDTSAALVLFTRGTTLVILSTVQPPGVNATNVLAPVAMAQYARLAGY